MNNIGEYGPIAIITENSGAETLSNELFKRTSSRMEALYLQGYRTIVLMGENSSINSIVSMAATRLIKRGVRFRVVFVHAGVLSLPIPKHELSMGEVVSLF